jgi:hypothetical protein
MPVRNELLTRLTQQLHSVLIQRTGAALALWGEIGIGKSWTAQQLLRRVPCRHYTLHAAAHAERLVDLLPAQARYPERVERALAHWRRGTLDTQTSVEALIIALRPLAPFIVQLEDLHEAEPEQLELWTQLARRIRRSPGLGLIATSQPPPPKPFASVQLTALSDDETAALLSEALGAQLPLETQHWIMRRTRGNPLYSLEYLRFLCRQGYLYQGGINWRWRQPPAELIPYSIEDLVMQQVENLADTPEMRAAIEARAIFLYEVSRAVWAAVAEVSEETLERCRRRLVENGLMTGDSYAHPLFCQAIRQNMPPARKQALARRVISLVADNQPLLAAQYVAAAALTPSEAIPLLTRASVEASRRGLHSDAALLFARRAELETGDARAPLLLAAAARLRAVNPLEALRLARLAAQAAPSHDAALMLYADLLLHDGQWEAAAAALEGCPAAQRQSVDYQLLQLRIRAQSFQVREARRFWQTRTELHAHASATTRVEVALALIDCGDFEGAKALLAALLADPELTSEDRGFALDAQARLLYQQGDYPPAQQAAAEAIALLEMTPQPRRLAQVLGIHAMTCWIQGNYAAANADLQRAFTTFQQTEDRRGVNCWRAVLGFFKTEQGAYEEAEALIQACRLQLVQEAPSPQLARTEALLGLLYLSWNPPLAAVVALRHARAAVQLVRQLDIPTLYTELLSFCARVEALHGDAGAALTLAQEALARATALRQPEPMAAARAACGVACAQLGRQDEALPYLRSAMADYERLGLSVRAQFVGLDLDVLLGDAPSAARRLAIFEALGISAGVAAIRRSFPNLSAPHAATLPSALRLEVLGTFTLWHGSHTVHYHAHKGKELLAYLLESRLAGRYDVSGLELRDALYPHLPDEEGRTALKQLVYRLRSSLGREVVLTTTNGYALGTLETDVESFVATHNTQLWHGPYLATFGGGWNASVGDQLHHKLFELASRQLASNPLEAARLGRILLEADPYSHRALRLTLQALLASDQPQSCLELYQMAQQRFAEVGVVLPAAYPAFLAPQ